MRVSSVTEELEALPKDHRFDFLSAEIVGRLSRDAVGLKSVSEILSFMESHPKIDYGMPGSLVHYVEEFYRKGYEPLLVESIRRKPTAHTLWLLNRVINGTDDADERQIYVSTLCNARRNPMIDKDALDQLNFFIDALGVKC